MSGMQKAFNGFQISLMEIQTLMFDAIAKHYDLDADEVAKIAYESTEKITTKDLKFKLQSRQPKNGAKREKRGKSGYQLYCASIREDVKKMLVDVKDERTFKNTKGETITLDKDTFDKETGPKFNHINQKSASMWAGLSEADREIWRDEAKSQNSNGTVEKAPVVKKAAESKGKKEPVKKTKTVKKSKKGSAESDGDDHHESERSEKEDKSESSKKGDKKDEISLPPKKGMKKGQDAEKKTTTRTKK